MLTPAIVTIALFVVSIVLVAGVVLYPEITAARAGKIFAFVALFLLPIISGGLGLSEHFEKSKQTTFCLSCHVMAPYGKSLYIDDKHYIAAAHFQNHRIPVDEACYTCHTDYVLYGGVRAKLRGLRHVYVQYLGHVPVPEDIHLYSSYNNRECLHCHLGARSFEDEPTHSAMRDDLISNQMSCLTSGCHDTVHNVKDLANQRFWKEPH
jgi:cytochrome c-type protein NapC